MAEWQVAGGFDEAAAVFVISVAAELAGMHPQTLRQYDRLGLVSPDRTAGRGRRYSARNIAQLREIQRLSQEEGVNLAGIKRILDLENQVHALRVRLAGLEAERRESARTAAMPVRRLFFAGAAGDIVPMPLDRRRFADPSTALVVWRPSTHL
jgi:MerR family transcriptional regulator/heat shock protein HspR